MADMMMFPNTVEEFMEQYKIVDTEKIYTNGTELVPIFRMMQWFEHVSATDKNVGSTAQLGTNLAEVGMDTISRRSAIDAVTDELDMIDHVPQWVFNRLEKRLKQLPSAQPEPCEDAVSRKAVIDMMDEWKEACADSGHKETASDIMLIRKDFIELPPVTPKQRTGHWIPVGVAEAVGGESAQWGSTIAYHKCSECDGQALRDDFEQEVLSDFCPHCGCRMERMSE